VLLNDGVVEELKDDPAVDPSRIAIAVDDGVVTMSGSVPTYRQKVEAERVVRRVIVVRAVANDVKVEVASDHVRDDTDIAAAAANMIRWHSFHEDRDNSRPLADARREGVGVDGVTLWLFGGVARLRGEAKTAKSEFKIAASGPAVSLALAAVFAATAVVLHHFGVESIVVAVAWWLAGINLILALFNLLPAAPLDRGRVLRAILWRRHRDPVRAAVTAARCGRVLGYVLIGLGLLDFLAGADVDRDPGRRVDGLCRLVFVNRGQPRGGAGAGQTVAGRCDCRAGDDTRPADGPGLDNGRGVHPALPVGRSPLGISGSGPWRRYNRADHADTTAQIGAEPARHHAGA
jgi:Zn-dependent protease